MSSIRLASLIGALVTFTATASMQSTIPAPPDVAAPPANAAKTASGEDMDAEALTAAHRTLPIGTMVLVENLDNGRVVKVCINDRGPFTGNRIIDVSQAAAKELDMVADGVANVRVTRVPAVIAAGAGGTP